MTPPPSVQLRRWTVGAVLMVLATLHAGLALWGVRHAGVTYDETAHLTAGYSYWKFNDYRLQPENGNLPQRWAGLAVLSRQPKLDPAATPELWAHSQVWRLGNQFFFENDNPIFALLQRARSAMLVWSLALGALVFFWSRSLWGTPAALGSTALYAVSPTILANGPLVTSDTTAAFWLLLATWCWGRALTRPRTLTVAASIAATAVAFVAKFSCVLLIPIFALMALAHLGTRRQRGAGGSEIGREALRIAGVGVLHGAGIWMVIWIAFGLRFSPVGAGMPDLVSYFVPWEHLLADGGPLAQLISFAREARLLPEAYMEGFAHVRYQGSARNAFLFGAFSDSGWWWFFPATFLLKSTTAELLVTWCLLAALIWVVANPATWTRLPWVPVLPLLAFLIVYGVFSIFSTLNIGHRHILPLYPVLFIAAGGLVRLGGAGRRWWLFLLPLLSLLETWHVAPHHLTFFNRLSGGPTRAWEKLVDSSLDWGQGLPALATWVARNQTPDEPLFVSYFGNDKLSLHLPAARPLAPIASNFPERDWFELQPGLYCISATMMQDVYSPYRGNWSVDKERTYQALRADLLPKLARNELSGRIVDFGRDGTERLWTLDRLRFNRLCAYLKLRPPIAHVANCMLVFRLSAEELAVITAGDLSELAQLLELAHRSRSGS